MNQRLGVPLTNSPCRISAMRQEVESCLGGFRHTVIFFVEAVPVMTTIRLRLLVWFMALSVWALTINIHNKCTLDHA